MRADTSKAVTIGLILVIIVGFALLISRHFFQLSGIIFEVFTYALSVIALILAIISVANSVRQARIMNRMVREIHAAITELKEVTNSNEQIEAQLREEYHMNKVITDVLSEHGIGDTKKTRALIARKVTRRLKSGRSIVASK